MEDIGDARRIRKRVLECFEIANLPTTNDHLREQFLDSAVVGGGPIGMAFAAELSELIHEDLKIFPAALIPKVLITVYDVAPKVLSMFDDKLSKYAMETFRHAGVKIKASHHVKELWPGLPRTGDLEENVDDVADPQGCYTLTTREDGDVGVGICVWSIGNMMNPFVHRNPRQNLQCIHFVASLLASQSVVLSLFPRFHHACIIHTSRYNRVSPNAHLTSEHPALIVSAAPTASKDGLTSTRSIATRLPVSCTHSAM